MRKEYEVIKKKRTQLQQQTRHNQKNQNPQIYL